MRGGVTMKKLICAIMTKFDQNGNMVLDNEYKRFLKDLIKNGMDAFMVGGTNGEFPMMNIDERMRLLEFIKENFEGEVEIIAHVGAANFKDTLKLGEHALSLGIKKLSVVAPYYFKQDDRAIVDYFVDVAEALKEAKLLIYNIPGFTGNRIEPDHILEIVERAPNVVGMKDSDARPWIVQFLKKRLGKDFLIYGGFDNLIIAYMIRGADGQVSGTSNVFPKLLKTLLESLEMGDYEKAVNLQEVLDEVIRNVSGHPAFLGANKFALALLGYDIGFPRKPSRILIESERRAIKNYLERVREWSIS